MSYVKPPFIFDFPMPEDLARKPQINFEQIPDACFRKYFPLYDSNDEQKRLFSVFSVVAREKKYYTYQQHAKTAIAQGFTQEEFDLLLHELFKMGVVHTKVTETGKKKVESINAFIFLQEAQERQRKESKTKKAVKEEYKQIRVPEEFKKEEYLAEQIEGIYVRPHNLSSADCREILCDESLQEIYNGNNERIRKEMYIVFSIVALDADWDGKKIVENVGTYGTAKSFALIVHRAQKFNISQASVTNHLLALLEQKNIHTVMRNNLCFFGTPFLKTAKLRRDCKDEEKKTRLHMPEFMKNDMYRAPQKPEGFKRWGRPLIEKDVAIALHAESLIKIHPQPLSEEGKLFITIYNIVAFGCEKIGNEIMYPEIHVLSNTTFGTVITRCRTFGIENADFVTDCLEKMLKAQVLHVRNNDTGNSGYYFVATPFLRNARLIDDPENWMELRPEYVPKADDYVSSYKRELPPDWLELFEKPIPSIGTKHSHQHFETRKCLTSFHHESLVKIHPDYESAEGQLRCTVFDIVAFPGIYIADPTINEDAEDEREFSGAKTRCASNYGTLLRAATLAGVCQEDFDFHLLALCESKCVFCFKTANNARFIDATPFLATVRTTKKPREKITRRRKFVDTKGEEEKEENEVDKEEDLLNAAKKAKIDKVIGIPQTEKKYSHCIGTENIPCVYGKDRGPVIAEEEWSDCFPFKKSAAGRLIRCDRCFTCSGVLKDLKRESDESIMTRLTASLITNCHVDPSTPYVRIREALIKVPNYFSNFCQICGGEFDETFKTTENGERIPKRPWSRSYNVIDPQNGNRFTSIEEIYERGSIVHQLCNYGQHTSSMQSFIDDCKFIANRIDLARFENHRTGKAQYPEELITILPPKIEAYVCKLTQTNHKMQFSRIRTVISNTLRTYEYYTALKIGYGPENDLDLNTYVDWPSSFKFSIDKIDTQTAHEIDSPANDYRVTFRMLNLAKNSFGDVAVFDFLTKIIKKYKK